MPTGYTCDVQDGKVTTLEDYAKTCARAFLWQSRDSNERDLLKLVSDETTVKYYEKSLAEARNDLAVHEALDEAGWRKMYDAENAATLKWTMDYNERKDLERLRYTTMLEKVRAWTPPSSEHYDLKKFMIEQLESSIKFDCRDTDWNIELVPFASWKKTRYETIKTKVIKQEEDYNRQMSRQDGFLTWVNDLLESVKEK
jgi:hypothetical protein